LKFIDKRTNLSNEFLIKKTKEIVKLLTEEYVGKNGLLFKGINLKTGKKFSESIVNDLGDYVQYICYFGKITSNEKLVKWCENQVELASEYCQMPNGFFINVNTSNPKKPKKTNLRIFNIEDNIDTLTGLLEICKLTKSERVIETSKKLADGIINSITKGFIPSIIFSNLRFPISSPLSSGSYIEELVNFSKITRNFKYRKKAEEVANSWLETNYFEEIGLFPEKIFPKFESKASWNHLSRKFADYTSKFFWNFFSKIGLSAYSFSILPEELKEYVEILHLTKNSEVPEKFRISYSTMMKKNTMMLFGILALYRETKKKKFKEAFFKWYSSFKEKIVHPKKKVFYDVYNPIKKRSFDITLTKNSSVIEAFIDAHTLFGRNTKEGGELIETAKNCVDYWIDKQDNTTGLIPETPEVQYKYKFDLRAMLDANVDFTINLFKMYEIFGEKRYYNTGIKALNGIFKYFYTKKGYILYCNYKTGEPIGIRGYFIKTKFNGLLLKAPLLLLEIKNGKKIFKDRELWSLARDR